jgi:AraC-like DNA-binding protein
MTQIYFQQEKSAELAPFPHIVELGTRKIQTVQLNSLQNEASSLLRFFFIIEGKYQWVINGEEQLLFPGDLAIVLPEQVFGAKGGFMDIGAFSWISLKTEGPDSSGKMRLSEFTSLTETETNTIGKILLSNSPVLSRMPQAGTIMQQLLTEVTTQEIGYASCVNHLIDDLFILVARQLTKQNNSRRDFPETFSKLEQVLRENLSHQWTVEEMAALVGLGTTAFTEKVKKFTGFSPLNYLINIRISEAMRLLKKQEVNLTDIALDVGFYSSQHFSTTFKKLTGYTPSQFKKNNSSTA